MRLANATIRSCGARSAKGGTGLASGRALHSVDVVARLAVAAVFAGAMLMSAPALAQGQPRPGQGQRPQQQQPPQQQQAQPEPSELDQIELTPSHIDAFVATEMALKPITSRLKGEPNKQQQAQIEAVVKKNGFKDFDEYGDIASNIGFVFAGINPESKKYEPAELIKRDIATVTGDTRIPAPQKKQILDSLQEAQKSLPALKYPKNAELVAQNYDRLKPVMAPEGPPPQQPPPQGQGQPPRQQQQPRR
jgi:hypothetical protein